MSKKNFWTMPSSEIKIRLVYTPTSNVNNIHYINFKIKKTHMDEVYEKRRRIIKELLNLKKRGNLK